ncbi:uncharacterized protein F5147DRAFT_770104 [Suillus discolor]|uniref:Uncharacterized protein n=1 Tax=Suillus discolor TaxID=1912936 RepID=A0A9P7JXC3_9AGAM|nr:uncharacterized protein F5147DRAFT_770104 [Suillus discolor]KAG2114790.1 hypothetical protein F5147DRAFT_770104 [Suillus discolor]
MGLSQPAESSSGLQAFIDGKQTKQTTQVLTATNARQTPNGWVCPNLRSPPGIGLQAFIDGKQTKQTTQVLTATNARQTPNGWVCPNPRSPPVVCKHSLTANRPSRLLKFRRPSMSDKPLTDGSVPTRGVLQEISKQYMRILYQGRQHTDLGRRLRIVAWILVSSVLSLWRPNNATDPMSFMPHCILNGALIMYSSCKLPLSGRDSQTFNANMSNKPRADGSAPTHLMSLDINRTRADNTAFGG